MKTYRRLPGPILAVIFVLLGLSFGQSTLAATDRSDYSQAQLEQILAPIALYPDSVLSHILIASTHPLDLIQAARWWQSNRDLTGESAVNAVEHRDWDPSVKALVAFPEIIARMNDDLEWTEDLANAFLRNEAAVMASIQALRAQAYAAGNLDSLEHFRVVRDAETIVIEPVRTQVIFIPYYDSRRVYGHWRWRDHPPVYWDYSRHGGHVYERGIHFGWSMGIPVAAGFYFSAFRWHSGQVVVMETSGQSFFSDRVYAGRDIARHHDARHWNHHRGDRHGRAHEWRPDRQYHVRYGRPHIDARFRDSRRHRWLGDRHGIAPHRHAISGIRRESDSDRQTIPPRDLLPPGGVMQPGPEIRRPRGRAERKIERRRAVQPSTFTRVEYRASERAR